MVQTALVALDLMPETPLQGLAGVIEPLLRVAYAVQQLAAQRARERSIWRWRSMTSGTINSAAALGVGARRSATNRKW